MNDVRPPATGRRRADPRLPGYLVGGFGGLILAIVTGQPELAALAAPFLALAALGVVDARPHAVTGSVTLRTDRVIEGDIVEGEISVEWDGVAEIDILLAGGHGIVPVEPAHAIGWSLPPGRGPVTRRFRVRAGAWGAHDVGTLWVRMRRPGGLVVWERKLARAPALRVLPEPVRLDRLLKPAEPRAVAGARVSRLRGHGTDFAELRPYRPGDRLRDVSWATSARLGEMWVTVHHPERTGTVLLLLDAFFGDDPRSTEALARAARAAWAVASLHLSAQDRVGLLSRGRTVAWLPPRGGRRARWLLLDELLAVGAAAEDRRHHARGDTRIAVPADALVVGITGLGWPRFLDDLLHYRRAGHATAALVIDTADLLPPPADALDDAARRIWFAQRAAERLRLERGGIPTAMVTVDRGVATAISTLRRRMNALRQPARKRVAGA
ncbi:MAG TPA: DUF58 domain-containing protein [Albitalea sp.]